MLEATEVRISFSFRIPEVYLTFCKEKVVSNQNTTFTWTKLGRNNRE